jgi:hypothetical protein
MLRGRITHSASMLGLNYRLNSLCFLYVKGICPLDKESQKLTTFIAPIRPVQDPSQRQ